VGEYCTIMRNTVTKEESFGCVNSSVSLIERNADDAVVQPPITGGLHLFTMDTDQVLQMESYLCSHDGCNQRFPKDLNKKRMTCSMTFQLKMLVGKIESTNAKHYCKGEFCWNATIENSDKSDIMFKGYFASGWLTPIKGK